MTKDERLHLSRVVELGCLICKMPPEIHHVRTGVGKGQRSSHKRVLPLCHVHHRTGGFGVAFHAGKKTWQEKYGDEESLLEIVKCALEWLYG